jgi:cytochrome c-type biogenesis protein CcmH/NrfG
VKQPRRIIPWLAVFAVGFFLGIVYSAWRLDKATTPGPPGHSMGQQEGPSKEDIASRIQAVTRMLEKNPNNIQALIQLGNDYSSTDNHEKAIEAYQKAIKLDPSNADLSTELGMAYRKLAKPELAVEAFRKAIEVDPDNSKALFYLGRVLMVDLKDGKGALEAWETFLKKSPDHPHAVMIKPWVEQLRQEVAKKN